MLFISTNGGIESALPKEFFASMSYKWEIIHIKLMMHRYWYWFQVYTSTLMNKWLKLAVNESLLVSVFDTVVVGHKVSNFVDHFEHSALADFYQEFSVILALFKHTQTHNYNQFPNTDGHPQASKTQVKKSWHLVLKSLYSDFFWLNRTVSYKCYYCWYYLVHGW